MDRPEPELDMADEHGMAHRWGRMADRGVRFFSLRAMRGVHATEPLSLRGYIGMVLTEATLTMLAVASGELTEDTFAAWLRSHIVPR